MPRSGSDSIKLFHRNDLLLILAFAVLAAMAFAFVKMQAHPGSMVRVTVDGQLYGEYSLNESQEIVIGPMTGPQTNISGNSRTDDSDDSRTNVSDDSRTNVSDDSRTNVSDNSRTDDSGSSRTNVSGSSRTDDSDDSRTNVLVISDGFADMTRADCPDKICVHHRPISKAGETIVCLPHKVVVEVTDEGEGKELDGVAE